jgi:hypothetical protein
VDTLTALISAFFAAMVFGVAGLQLAPRPVAVAYISISLVLLGASLALGGVLLGASA